MQSTYVYSHDDCLLHEPGASHPECPARLRVVHEALQNSASADRLRFLEAPPGSDAQVLLAHTAPYLARVRALHALGGSTPLDPDTILSPGSLQAALRGVGAACAAVDALLQGDCRHAFVLTRPPGHHATADQAMGFCIFNHAAIAALYAQQQKHLQRVVVVDFDVHHGNGTQDILRDHSGLLYVSTHQSPLYPDTGFEDENQSGNIANIPLPAGLDGAAYRQLFSAQVLPLLRVHQPELLIVSAGFDAHTRDPLAALNLREADYAWLGGQLRALADECAEGRLLSVLEGGYNLDVLGRSVEAYVSACV
jgi:acetoin utilization deacetylase AcuC-like enzyme